MNLSVTFLSKFSVPFMCVDKFYKGLLIAVLSTTVRKHPSLTALWLYYLFQGLYFSALNFLQNSRLETPLAFF